MLQLALTIIIGVSMSGICSSVAENTEEMPNTRRHRSAMTVVTGRFNTNLVNPIAAPPVYCSAAGASLAVAAAVSPPEASFALAFS